MRVLPVRVLYRMCYFFLLGEQAAASLKADLSKLTSSAAVEVEEELSTMTARRKELSSKNVRARASGPPLVEAYFDEINRGRGVVVVEVPTVCWDQDEPARSCIFA